MKKVKINNIELPDDFNSEEFKEVWEELLPTPTGGCESYRFEIVDFSEEAANIENANLSINDFWTNLLGQKPEKEFSDYCAENKCYKCGSKDVISMDSPSWTGTCKCNDCDYTTYFVYGDKMGGGGDSIAISNKGLKFKDA